MRKEDPSRPFELRRAAVLVVEDEPAIVELLGLLLGPLDTQILTARSGAEALEHLGRTRPTLVTLDMVLPDMNGLRILESIRQRRELDDVPVIMVTAQSDSASLKRAYRYGASDFISKPFSVDLLESKLRMWLRLSRLADVAYQLRDLAHEVRNPLTSVMSAAQLIARADATPEQRQRFSRAIVQEAERIGRLVNATLLHQPAAPGATTADPLRLLRDVIDVNLPEPEDRARVHLLRQAALPALRVDPDRLRQMLVNLLDNALAATSDGGEVRVDAAPDPEGVTLTIHDTGVGIAPAVLPHIFEDGYTTRPGTSRGLGLGITRRLCQGAGGQLAVASAPGSGTTFSLWLPLASISAADGSGR